MQGENDNFSAFIGQSDVTILEWYKKSTNRSENPIIVLKVGEKDKPIFKFVVDGLIKSGYNTNEITGITHDLIDWYLKLSEKEKTDEFLFMRILIQMYEKYTWRLPPFFDNSSLITNLEKFMSTFFYNFDRETLELLEFSDYFVYGLTDKLLNDSAEAPAQTTGMINYQKNKVALYIYLYGKTTKNRGYDIVKSQGALVPLKIELGLSKNEWYDSPLFFLKKIEKYLTIEDREKLDSLNEIRQENISLMQKQVEYQNFKEIMNLNLIIIMIEQISNYGSSYATEVLAKIKALTKWLTNYPFIYLNKKGDIFNVDLFKQFVAYYENLAIPSHNVGEFLEMKCKLLYWFFLKLRTIKMIFIDVGFDDMNHFCDKFDQCKVCQLLDSDKQLNLKSIESALLVKNTNSLNSYGMLTIGPYILNTINYRNDYDLNNGFNVSGVPIRVDFWKFVDRISWLDDSKPTRYYPIGYFLGLVNTHCVEMPMSAEGFFEHLRDHYGEAHFPELKKVCSETFTFLSDKINSESNDPALRIETWKQDNGDMIINNDDYTKVVPEYMNLDRFINTFNKVTGTLNKTKESREKGAIWEEMFTSLGYISRPKAILGGPRVLLPPLFEPKLDECSKRFDADFYIRTYYTMESIYKKFIPTIISMLPFIGSYDYKWLEYSLGKYGGQQGEVETNFNEYRVNKEYATITAPLILRNLSHNLKILHEMSIIVHDSKKNSIYEEKYKELISKSDLKKGVYVKLKKTLPLYKEEVVISKFVFYSAAMNFYNLLNSIREYLVPSFDDTLNESNFNGPIESSLEKRWVHYFELNGKEVEEIYNLNGNFNRLKLASDDANKAAAKAEAEAAAKAKAEAAAKAKAEATARANAAAEAEAAAAAKAAAAEAEAEAAAAEAVAKANAVVKDTERMKATVQFNEVKRELWIKYPRVPQCDKFHLIIESPFAKISEICKLLLTVDLNNLEFPVTKSKLQKLNELILSLKEEDYNPNESGWPYTATPIESMSGGAQVEPKPAITCPPPGTPFKSLGELIACDKAALEKVQKTPIKKRAQKSYSELVKIYSEDMPLRKNPDVQYIYMMQYIYALSVAIGNIIDEKISKLECGSSSHKIFVAWDLKSSIEGKPSYSISKNFYFLIYSVIVKVKQFFKFQFVNKKMKAEGDYAEKIFTKLFIYFKGENAPQTDEELLKSITVQKDKTEIDTLKATLKATLISDPDFSSEIGERDETTILIKCYKWAFPKMKDLSDNLSFNDEKYDGKKAMIRIVNTLGEMVKILTILSNSISESKNSKTDLTDTFNLNLTKYLNEDKTAEFFSKQDTFINEIVAGLAKLDLNIKENRMEELTNLLKAHPSPSNEVQEPYGFLDADPIIYSKF